MMATGGDCGEGKGPIVWGAPDWLRSTVGRAILISGRARVGPRHFTRARERIVALSRERNIDILLSNNPRSCQVQNSLYPDHSSAMNAPFTFPQPKRQRMAAHARGHAARDGGMRSGGIENAAERRRERRKDLEAAKCGLEPL
jgi:hypothetical protein